MKLDDGHDAGTRVFTFGDASERIEDPRRLERLRSTGLLTARRRPQLDSITHLAAEMTEAHSSRVSLVEVDRQVFPSVHRRDVEWDEPYETPISDSFCQYVVMNDAPLVVEDARTHPVLASHPAVLEGGVVAYAGFPVRAPDGEVLGALCVVDRVPRAWTPVQLSGLGDLATAVDTKIALRLSRRELHLDHARLMQVLDGAAGTLIVIADAEGVIRTMNRAAEDALGPVIDHVGTQALTDLVGAWGSLDLGTDLDDAQDWSIAQPDGEQLVFSVRVNKLDDPEGALAGYIVVGDDVSARRRTEDLLRDTVRKQAEAVARLEALEAQRSTFIATASHELRTPVTSILGFTELLADGECGDLTDLQHEMVGRVVRNGRRLEHLIEDLLALDRIGSGHLASARTDVQVHPLVEGAWGSLQGYLAGRRLTTSVTVPPDALTVHGDAIELERALLNLLTNAVKYTPDGGCVRLTVCRDTRGVVFEVGDTGRGIDEEDQPNVFEPFFRSKDAYANAVQGSGIGLAVVRRIVESHGGEVALTSVVGEGTRVRFTLPTSVSEAPSS